MAERKLLIIDDESDIREVAAMSLEAVCGWCVMRACSGKEGLELAQEHTPDAILLDVMMPDLDGPSTLQLLRSNSATAQIPVNTMLIAMIPGSSKLLYCGGI